MLAHWIRAVLRRKPGSSMVFSEVVHSQIDDLQGVKIMLAERLERWMQEKEAQFMRSGMEKGIQQGIEQGIEKGWQKGRQEGEILALQRLLVRRFGPLPPAIQARLNRASTEEIEAWLDAVMDVPSLEALFVEQPPA